MGRCTSCKRQARILTGFNDKLLQWFNKVLLSIYCTKDGVRKNCQGEAPTEPWGSEKTSLQILSGKQDRRVPCQRKTKALHSPKSQSCLQDGQCSQSPSLSVHTYGVQKQSWGRIKVHKQNQGCQTEADLCAEIVLGVTQCWLSCFSRGKELQGKEVVKAAADGKNGNTSTSWRNLWHSSQNPALLSPGRDWDDFIPNPRHRCFGH